MARLSRRRGPAANFDSPATYTTIPGLSITRTWDDGELFISCTCRLRNSSGANKSWELSIFVNDVQSLTDPFLALAQNGVVTHASFSLLHPITRGTHTVDLRTKTTVFAANQFIEANMTELSVLQLPQWDAEEDIQ